ncbi:MAG: Ig-like domain repeat protein [Acidobacteriia bacterium]|nr:Ig-like domain repeat protein [Terriglobia bacterium]
MLLFLTVLFIHPGIFKAASDIVISQVYGGGGNSGATYKNDFIEIFNRGSIAMSLSGWSVQYTSATGAAWQVTNLTGVSLQPGQYYLIQEAQGSGGSANLPTPDAIGTITMGATSGKVALVKNTTALTGACPTAASIADLVGFGNTASCFEGSGAAPAPGNTTAIIRNSNGCADTHNNSSDFATGTPNPRNSSSTVQVCGGGSSTDPCGVGTANPSGVLPGDTVLLTVIVTPGTNPASTGLAVIADLTAIGNSPTQSLFDDGTHGDTSAGDNVFSVAVSIAPGVSAGAKSLSFIVSDSQARSSTGSISLTIQSPPLAIHSIQGNGLTSPFTGTVVTTTGIVTAVKNNGFFLQTPDSAVDGDSDTSEGIFVFTGSSPPSAAAVGNSVNVSGTVQEFVPASDPASPPSTEIGGTISVVLNSTGNSLPAAIPLTGADLSPSGSAEQLERLEGMRVHVESLTVVSPTQGNIDEPTATAVSTGVFYGVITGTTRPFREPGIDILSALPSGAPCCVPRFDGNPERIRIDSDGQVGASPLEVAAGAVLTSLTGVLDYASRTYTILPDPAAPPTVTGMASATAVPAPSSDEFTVASFNLGRFFDAADDPLITEPVLSSTAFNTRLSKSSLAFRMVMQLPDIVGVEEVENLAALESLAQKINDDAVAAGMTNPQYQAFLEEGNDPGGIDVGFLVRSTRVAVVDVVQQGKEETYVNPLTGGSELLNDRPPLVLRVNVTSPGGALFPVTVIVNHLRSMSAIDDPIDGPRVRAKRAAQAEYLANLLQARQTANPAEQLIVLGDFNAFPFNDGYVDVMGTLVGAPAPGHEVVVSTRDLVEPDLKVLLNSIPESERYSYLLDGNAQVLDHVLVTSNLQSRLRRFVFARNNADFPESYRNDPGRPERVSDHDTPVAYFTLPALLATMTSLVSSANPSPFGQPATFLATVNPVSSGSTTPSGAVTFSDGAQMLGTAPLQQGTARLTVSTLAIGPHSITANYSGDATFSPSSSNPIAENVIAAADLGVTINSAASSVRGGQTISFQIDIANKGPNSATQVSLNADLPDHTLFASLNAPTDWSCTVPGIGSRGTIRCSTNGLGATQISQINVTARLDCSFPDKGHMTSTASISGNEFDPNGTNNLSNATWVASNPVSISPVNQTFAANGGWGSVRVTAPLECNWQTNSSTAWISVRSGALGVGDGTVDYIVTANHQSNWRSGTLGVGGKTFTVMQAGGSGAGAQLSVSIPAGGVATFATSNSTDDVKGGYAVISPNFNKRSLNQFAGGTSENLFGVAVISTSRNGIVTSEAGVSRGVITKKARLMVQFEEGTEPDDGADTPVPVNTGMALVNYGVDTAHITFQLFDPGGMLLVTGQGSLESGEHRAFFIDELPRLAPDFVLPVDFASTTKIGSLEIQSDQPLAVTALRLVQNERGDSLLTTTPVADINVAQATQRAYIPHFVDGGGYRTVLYLLNTSGGVESGEVKFYDGNGVFQDIHVRGRVPMAPGVFAYNIPAGGLWVFESESIQEETLTGSIHIEPHAFSPVPKVAGLLRSSTGGVVVTETGLAPAEPSTHVRLFVDRSRNHNTGVAFAVPDASPLLLHLNAYMDDGNTPWGSAVLDVPPRGHAAKFVDEIISSLPSNFVGVLDVTSDRPFVALTLRSLANARGDSLLTTFPVAAYGQSPPFPIFFPQIADGGGFMTEFILLNPTGALESTISLFGDEGKPLETFKK